MDLASTSINHDLAAKEYIDSAMQCFSRAKDLTQQLLIFAKGGAPNKKNLSIETIIQESVKLSLSGSNIRCEKKMRRNLFSVEADHGQMNQVFNNILLNARQSMPNGGMVTIGAHNKEICDNEITGSGKLPGKLSRVM